MKNEKINNQDEFCQDIDLNELYDLRKRKREKLQKLISEIFEDSFTT